MSIYFFGDGVFDAMQKARHQLLATLSINSLESQSRLGNSWRTFQVELAMAVFSKWIKQAVDSLVDPEKGSRQAQLISVIHRDLFQKRQQFSLSTSVQGIEFRPQDLEFAKEHVYRDILSRAWSDGTLTDGEKQVATWAARVLELKPNQVKQINLAFARDHFATALAHAMDDGYLDADEEKNLQQIAGSVGMSMAEFSRGFFFQQGESFLRGIFSAFVSDNHISQEGWERFITTAQKLGISHSEMLQSIQSQARRFVEHVLADAKSDGQLSDNEEAVLNWMIQNLGLPEADCRYVAGEVAKLRFLTRISQGKLPSIEAPYGIAIRAGEIVHFHDQGIWRRVRLLKNGPQSDDHAGTVTITDDRLIFTGGSISQTIRYRSIVSFRGGEGTIQIQVEGKPINTFYFPDRTIVPFAIFKSAVAMANQTLVRPSEGQSSRHIPRDVRQRVWQAYSGRCAECNADDYLEFDHIIPVARGGSNSESNIQLLCRRCNLKKSDHI